MSHTRIHKSFNISIAIFTHKEILLNTTTKAESFFVIWCFARISVFLSRLAREMLWSGKKSNRAFDIRSSNAQYFSIPAADCSWLSAAPIFQPHLPAPSSQKLTTITACSSTTAATGSPHVPLLWFLRFLNLTLHDSPKQKAVFPRLIRFGSFSLREF